MSKKNVHDKLFKQVFSIASETKAFLQNFAAPDLLACLDLDSLLLENTSFINEKLSEYFSDIVWSCRVRGGEEIRISLLLEHKSYTDPLVHFQLLRYLNEAYEYQITKAKDAEEDKLLSLIVPIVIYHGKEKWKHRKIADLFTLPAESLTKYIPDFHYDVVDVRSMTNRVLDKIEQSGFLRTSFYLFRYKDNSKYFLENRARMFIFDNTITERERQIIFETVMNYITIAFKLTNNQVMTVRNDFLEELIRDKAYLPGSAADRWVKEGKEEGIKEGIKEGRTSTRKADAVKNTIGILKRLPTFSADDIIGLCTGITKQEIEKLRAILSENLPAKAEKIIMKSFFADLKLTQEDKAELVKRIWDYYTPNKAK